MSSALLLLVPVSERRDLCRDPSPRVLALLERDTADALAWEQDRLPRMEAKATALALGGLLLAAAEGLVLAAAAPHHPLLLAAAAAFSVGGCALSLHAAGPGFSDGWDVPPPDERVTFHTLRLPAASRGGPHLAAWRRDKVLSDWHRIETLRAAMGYRVAWLALAQKVYLVALGTLLLAGIRW